jgi:hypothetical protein
MSEWHPDRHIELTVPEKVDANGTDKAYLYLWVVPSNVQGNWRMELDLGDGKRQLIGLTFDQQYQMLMNASAEYALGQLKIETPLLRGDEISFGLTVGANPYRFTGKVKNGKIEGTAVTPGKSQLIPWRATKLALDRK